MAPRNTSAKKPAPAVTASQRKTRSATAGKRVVPPPVSAAKKPLSKKPKLATKEKGNEKPAEKGPSLAESFPKSVIIEACKQCNQFKMRANMVKDGLENAVAGVAVTINPDKKRKSAILRSCQSAKPRKRRRLHMKHRLHDGSWKDIIVPFVRCDAATHHGWRMNPSSPSSTTLMVGFVWLQPRRGCFEIRDGSGGVFISLLDMKRPFTPMRKLDMEKVIKDIIQKIN